MADCYIVITGKVTHDLLFSHNLNDRQSHWWLVPDVGGAAAFMSHLDSADEVILPAQGFGTIDKQMRSIRAPLGSLCDAVDADKKPFAWRDVD